MAARQSVEPAFVVKDYADWQKTWKNMEKAEAREERNQMRTVGNLVKTTASERIAGKSPKTAAGFKTRVRARGVAVEQSLRRVSGLRPDWGALQMREGLIPALDENTDEVEKHLAVMLDKISAREGF